MNRIKKSLVHRIVKSFSPKREVISKKRGRRSIPRSVTPNAIDYITNYLNAQLKSIVEACEIALNEINDNPNSYYRQHRYNTQVVKRAIDIVRGKST